MLIGLVALPVNAIASNCQDTLRVCDEVVKEGQKLIDEQKIQLSNYADKSALDEQIKSDQYRELQSPLKDPVKVGLAAAILVITLEVLTGHLK